MNPSNQELKKLISDLHENNSKELYYLLMDMGIYIDETKIKELQRTILLEDCRCGNNGGGDCESCLEARYV